MNSETPPTEKLTHALLIQAAAAWLWRKNFAVVITDMTHAGSETADAIGWKSSWSVLIECKVSRADFLADAQKSFRRMPETGMGSHRYYCAPEGLIKPEQLPLYWGLLEMRGGKLLETVKPEGQEYNARHEVCLLVSAMRRIGANAPVGIGVRCYTIDNKCRATLGIELDEAQHEA